MPTISARIIKKPRIQRFCSYYRCQKILERGTPLMRIYGNACVNDSCYTMYICLDCAGVNQEDEKIKNALKKGAKNG